MFHVEKKRPGFLYRLRKYSGEQPVIHLNVLKLLYWMSYYLDTCIWIDARENRRGQKGKPFGRYALVCLAVLMSEDVKIIVTDILIRELKKRYTDEELTGLFGPFHVIHRISTDGQLIEARKLSLERKIPFGDVLHAVIARDENAVFVTRDHHFRLLRDVVEAIFPENLSL